MIYGIRGNHRTENCTNAKLRWLDWSMTRYGQRKVTALVLLDLSAAFDTIDHGTLLKRLKEHGVEGTALIWFNNYLIDRLQATAVHNLSFTNQPGHR
jgi:hypothetical protein